MAIANFMPVGICQDCDMIFPLGEDSCSKCGRPLDLTLHELYFKEARVKIIRALQTMFVDDSA